MLILHGGFYRRHLLLWAEEETEIEGPRRAKPGRKPANPDARPHPYDPGPERIQSILRELGIKPHNRPSDDQRDDKECPSPENVDHEGVVWLPSKGEEPLPSSPMIGNPPPNQAKIRLAPWRVSTAKLLPEGAIQLLGRCRERHTLGAGIVIGDDLGFWASALQLGGSLVAREKFLPGLVEHNGAHLALWEPVITGEDAETTAWLAENMPAPARAFSSAEAANPPAVPARRVVVDFLTHVVDWLVRSSGKQRSPLPADQFESIHDAWFHALRAETPELDWDEAEIDELYQQIREWQQPIAIATNAPWRLCFRLEEPEPDEDEGGPPENTIKTTSDEWHLRYLLQPHDDPSLRIPLSDVWDDEGDVIATLERDHTGVREFALAALGRAADICTVIDESLDARQPDGRELQASEAYRFLSDDARLLQQAGFGVYLPEWWTARGTRTQLTARATATSPELQGPGMLRLDSLVEFDWQLALGEHDVSLEELEYLASLKVPLVQVRGQWIEVDPDQIQTAIQFWKDSQNDTGTVRELMEMSVGATEPASDIEADQIRTEGALKELLETLEAPDQFNKIEVPDAFQGTLRPYQVRGYSWLAFLRRWGLGGCLADDMGLGKTIQTLALIQRDWHQGCQRPVLVVCPTSVVNNWKREASRFTPDLPVLVHHGSDRDKHDAFQETARSQAIIISSYGLLHRDVDFLQDIGWAGVVLDEAQNIKNPETKRARAARTLEADYRLALTGTPVQNHVGDLWSIMEFLNPGLLGSQSDFKRRFMIPIQSGSSPESAEKLRRITRPFVLRREKTDTSIIQDLPEKMEMKVYCNLTSEQASLYAAVLEDMNRGLETARGIQRDGIVFATLSKLKQVCNHPAHFLGDNSPVRGRSGKLERLTDMLEEIVEMGECALVFTQFRVMGDMLKTYLQETFGQEVLFLHGGVSQKKRTRMVDRFQDDDGRIPVFILSLKAGGTGLNLTAANHVFHFDRWWNPAVEDQATDRAHRIGQDRNVEVHKFICAGTVEERIDEMIEQKKTVADQVIGSGESWLSELSNDQLQDVFKLGRDAVAD